MANNCVTGIIYHDNYDPIYITQTERKIMWEVWGMYGHLWVQREYTEIEDSYDMERMPEWFVIA